MVPDLHAMLGEVLEQHSAKSQTISTYLKVNAGLKRYSNAFKLLYTIFVQQAINVKGATQAATAGALFQLHKVCHCHARNAYSAVLLIPGYEQVGFHPMWWPYNRLWNGWKMLWIFTTM